MPGSLILVECSLVSNCKLSLESCKKRRTVDFTPPPYGRSSTSWPALKLGHDTVRGARWRARVPPLPSSQRREVSGQGHTALRSVLPSTLLTHLV